MNYTNSICDGCGKAFREGDDIVVCPECGTPQHRECYKINNCCVNEYRHKDSFEWNGFAEPVKKMPKIKTEDKLPCPSCGHLNNKDAKVCENCSMKLIVFGMHLAESDVNRTASEERQNDSATDYKPPFVLGEGEGFDYDRTPEASDNQPPLQPGISPHFQNPAGFYGMPIPRPDTKRIKLSQFIGPNSEKYLRAFDKLERGGSVTFNWSAFFFAPYWFFYRKLYKPGIIFLTVMYIVSVVFSPIQQSFLEGLEQIVQITDEAAYTEAFIQLYGKFMPQLLLSLSVQIAVSLLAGLVAYPLYKKYTEKSLDAVSACHSGELADAMAYRAGGVSVMAVIFAWGALSAVQMMVSSIASGGSIF